MANENLKSEVLNATKWSAFSELLIKLVTPVVNIVLARLLTPSAFGVVTTLTMVISFAEIFTDAGFQKYLIQHRFKDREELYRSTNVAFWCNLALSIVLWAVIAVFRDFLAALVGSPGYGNALAIASISIPLAAFSSIQAALYKRDLDFKTLFRVRSVAVCIPLFVTIPLAIVLRSFWALIIGTMAKQVVAAVLLTVFSKWKPGRYFSFARLKEMFSFTMWSMIEAVSIWLTSYVDVFIVGTMLSQHYLGLYKTSSSLVGQITGIVTGITTPILFSSLSRLQNDESEFQSLFFKFQKIVGLLIIPLGVGIFLFSDLATGLLLGEQWMEASGFVGLWALMSSVTIVLSHYSSEVYRAKGKPKLSVLSQWLHIAVLWPVVLITVKYGFHTLYVARSLVRLEGVLVNLILMYAVVKISPWKMLGNILPSCIAAGVMAAVYFVLPSTELIWLRIVYVLLCAAVYAAAICCFREERTILFNLKSLLNRRK